LIPKLIHYCWFGPNQLTDLEKDCISSWKQWLPDYTLKCWNEDNFDVNSFGFTKEAYRLKKYAFVSDVCRLYALSNEGGIYLDTDMFLIRTFDSLLHYDFFIGDQKEGSINAAIMGSEPNHPLILELLKGYKKLTFDYHAPMDIPTYLNARLNREGIKVFSREYFYPLPYAKRGSDIKDYIRPETIAVHLWNHSWKNERDYLHDKNFSMALKQYFHRCLASPQSIWKDVFWLDFMKYFLADKFGFVYKLYRGK
jgi:mannosyltransferase OCH1-like enzyme